MSVTQCISCGVEFEQKNRLHMICSESCGRQYYSQEAQNVRSGIQYQVFEFNEESLPLLRYVATYAALPESPCAGTWVNQGHEVQAHAHYDLGMICVPGKPNPILWRTKEDDRLDLTSIFLHEYAHLIVPGGHSKEFVEVCDALHTQAGIPVDNEAASNEGVVGFIGGLAVASISGVYAYLRYEDSGATGAFYWSIGIMLIGIFSVIGSLLLLTNRGKLDHYHDYVEREGLDDYTPRSTS